MKRSLYPEKGILLGLLAAQIIATIQVHLSNAELHSTLLLLEAEGYLLVPNLLIMNRLQEFMPALIGGLFFTCSIGAGLSILTLVLAWCWDRLFNRNIIFAIASAGIWGWALFAVNRNGVSPLVTLYFIVIPIIIIVISLKWFQRSPDIEHYWAQWIHIIPVLLLAILWGSQMGSSLFLNIRDNLLFSNKFGTAFNDVYYRYTLYPARVFKTLDQKMLKTCRIEGDRNTSIGGTIEGILRNHDYLKITGDASVDLHIRMEGDMMVFSSDSQPLLEISHNAFRANPSKVLKRLSDQKDRYGFFRLITFYGLLIGFPLVLYVFLHAVFRYLISLSFSVRTASVSATALCVVAGLSLLFIVHNGRGITIGREDITRTLVSERWQDQVSALRTIAGSRLELGQQIMAAKLLHSPHIPVRYWLAKALAVSRDQDSLEWIVHLLNDPHPNVVCMALNSLARRGSRSVLDAIMAKIEGSDHWYVQWYAYKALKALGWKQKRSEQKR